VYLVLLSFIQWIAAIYPVDSVILPLNNRALIGAEFPEALARLAYIQTTLMAKQRMRPSGRLLMKSMRFLESCFDAYVSNPRLAITAPVPWLRTTIFIP